MGFILNRILSSCELSEGNRLVFMENHREGICQGKDTLDKYRSNIWHNLFNNEACQKALNELNRKCSLAQTKLKTVIIKHMDRQ